MAHFDISKNNIFNSFVINWKIILGASTNVKEITRNLRINGAVKIWSRDKDLNLLQRLDWVKLNHTHKDKHRLLVTTYPSNTDAN